ncbi:TIGR04283 family arsenosugar biosynthesis glycosyltransferase [Tissierella creatinophila]|uniref:4,4'-diaponeurosporenoate glycosyltransferase n=1 Tax=Tissierella creatinophila DSM 6911 TaxID=1123403 RepID=A0A1U7M634_TISCR|nr:TIGR04283 family arsenosugar biosynthesis glycosyltransferase [Tissierella creatinophila]OLS02767.1 UDP-Glc:alpha-D-GlcNAc-diphosphoundecaprenol beta-1,3-glucosyltransferase WfgD [Tissierella creatinophila DSM 6911]
MSTKMDKNISIIIPVYNEVHTIDKLIDNLEQFKSLCEIIFVDGESSDGTDIKIKRKYKLLYSPKKGRSNQMNYGASKSKGDILLFLHADSILPGDALSQIEIVISKGYKIGCFKIEFDSRTILMKICSFMSNLRVKLRNIGFGDQGIFIKKDYFYRLGEFKGIPIMEDYQLSIDIKRDGEKIALVNSKIITSERRFVKNGRFKTMIKMQRLQHMYRKGEDIEKIANLYK